MNGQYRSERTLSNLHRITLVSFLTYFVMSAMLAPIGILSGPMAEHFGQPVTEVTRQFSWLTGGILVGAVIALFIFDFFRLKPLFLLLYGLMGSSLVGFAVIDSLDLTRLLLGLIGTGCGIGLAAAAVTISHSYEEEARASMLVITDSFFSVAGFITAWLATWLVGQAFGWSTTYQLLALVPLAILLLSLVSEFPATTHQDLNKATAESWTLPVWLCVGALFLYTLGQNAMLFWLPGYAQTELGASSDSAGGLVGQYWLGMFLAQLFVAWWVLRIGVRRLAAIATTLACLLSIPLWTIRDVDLLTWLTLAWGFGNLALLKAVLSLAPTLVKIPSPRLVSLLLLGATTGTAVSPAVTSQIVEWTDTKTILMFSTASYALLFMLTTSALLLSRPKAAN